MKVHGSVALGRQVSFVDQAIDKINRTHLSQQTRIKSQLIDAIGDALGGCWHGISLDRIDLNQHDIAGLAAVN